MRPLVATLSAANLHHNVKVLRATAQRSRMLAMLKANAYGHGLVDTALKLAGHVDGYGVAALSEAIELRQAGITAPIFLMAGVTMADDLAIAAAHDITLIFHQQRQLDWLAAQTLPKKITAWQKINTGMNRLGFMIEDAPAAYAALSQNKNVQGQVGLLSHFACADEPAHPLNHKQIDNFTRVAAQIDAPKSFCNSPAIFAFPDQQFDLVRPGIALYGAAPLAGKRASDMGLKPVMTLSTELLEVRDLQPGDTVGYGARFVADEKMQIGIAAIGYGDGYPRSGGGAPVLVNGTRARVIAPVSMDLMAIDLRGVAAKPGDKVVLFGDGLPVDEVAASIGRISYELITGLHPRVQYRWVDEA